jgi:hypothetical protein
MNWKISKTEDLVACSELSLRARFMLIAHNFNKPYTVCSRNNPFPQTDNNPTWIIYFKVICTLAFHIKKLARPSASLSMRLSNTRRRFITNDKNKIN